MKNLIKIVLCSLLLISPVLMAKNKIKDYNKTFKVTEGGSLSINLSSGTVSVETWNRNEVKIVSNNLSERSLDDLSIIKSNNLIEFDFSGSGNSGKQSFRFTVPKKFNVNAKTSSGAIELFGNLNGDFYGNTAGGEIDLDDIEGDVDIRTAGGRIILHNIGGNLQAETLGGSIEAEDISGKRSKIKTLGGNINIGKTAENLSVLTYGGDIRIESLGDGSRVNTYGGDIKVKTLNGLTRLTTKGGDLIVSNGKGYLRARTTGGEIKVKSFTGGINGRTGAGNINVNLIPAGNYDTELNTGTGTIDLTIPVKSNVFIDAKIKGYSEYDDHSINTKLKKLRSHKSNSNIRAEYRTGSGKNKIFLITTNSDININTK